MWKLLVGLGLIFGAYTLENSKGKKAAKPADPEGADREAIPSVEEQKAQMDEVVAKVGVAADE